MRTKVSTLALVAVCGCFSGEETEELPTEDDSIGVVAPAPSGGEGGTGTVDPDMGDTTGDPAAPRGEVFAAPSEEEAARFLVQATFGGSEADIAAMRQAGYEDWIIEQLGIPARPMTDRLLSMNDANRHHVFDLFWNYAIENDDQLRQRVVYALSQIVVVSADHEIFWDLPEVFTRYADILQEEAFGNYGDLVRRVAMTPAMGSYLSSAGNQKHDPEMGVRPDENFAREVMQLFTIGLEELEMDGTPTGHPTYDNDDIVGLASVFTGLSWAHESFYWPDRSKVDPRADMIAFPEFHEAGPKTFLGGTVAAGADPERSVRLALDHLLAHRNLAPFVSKQLIQRLVTSNPSSDYVLRVATAFERGRYVTASGRMIGDGRRGDLAATVTAILLDAEARYEDAASETSFGRVREPVLRFAQLARALRDDGGAPRRGAPASAGRLRYAQNKDVLAQQGFAPSSVFGFTRPGYTAPGTWSGEAGLVAPALSLAGGTNAIGYLEFINQAASNTSWDMDFFELDHADLLPLHDEPERLVARLDRLMTYGAMAEDTKDRIVRAVRTITIEGDEEAKARQRLNRVKLAVFMAATSPAYAVQR